MVALPSKEILHFCCTTTITESSAILNNVYLKMKFHKNHSKFSLYNVYKKFTIFYESKNLLGTVFASIQELH